MQYVLHVCSPVQYKLLVVCSVGESEAVLAFLTRQSKADGGWLKEEGHTLTNGHTDAHGTHDHEEETEDGQEAGRHTQSCTRKTHLVC